MWKVVFVVLAAVFAVGALPGPSFDVDVNDQRVQNAATFAAGQHSQDFNDDYTRCLVRVVKARKQLAAGFKYVITVEMTTRYRNEGCAGLESAQTYNCTFTVWEAPLTHDLSLLSKRCDGQNN